jgi:ketosteroid isomerase-like protein
MVRYATVGIVFAVLIFSPCVVIADDLGDLKAAQEACLKAWGAKDLDALVEFEGATSAGFGHTTAFPRPQSPDKDSFRRGLEQYFNAMESIRITPHTAQFRVLGDTGLVWGHYAQTTKQKGGVIRTVYLRFAHTYMRIDGKWRLVLYHRSLIPNEDVW